MSRIGKTPVSLLPQVKVTCSEDGLVLVEGEHGILKLQLPSSIFLSIENEMVRVCRKSNAHSVKALHGLYRALINNMVIGVSKGFQKNLEIHGVGFRSSVKDKHLDLILGYSHPLLYPIPDGLSVVVTENTKISIWGIDKCLVGQFAANIRAFYPPEPYKGKGIRYAGENVRRKEGKTVQ